VPAPAPATETKRRRRVPPWLGGLLGVVVVLAIWQLLGSTVLHHSGTVPPPTKIASQMRSDGWSFYWSNAKVTIHEACSYRPSSRRSCGSGSRRTACR